MFSKQARFRMCKTDSPIRKGTNISEIEIFKGNPFNSFVREEIQNSLDVANAEDTTNPTIYEINVFQITQDEFPCFGEFSQMVSDNKQSWNTYSSDKKSFNFFDNVEKTMKRKKVWCLRSSDYNNTGVSRNSIDGKLSPYDSLIMGDATSDKHSGSGGSFGIGKNAAYTLTDLRTVVYSTITRDNEAFSVGVCKFPCYSKDGINYDGTGFFCSSTSETIEPFSFLNLDPSHNRGGKIGLDKYILGYNGVTDEKELKTLLLKTVFDNFFPAIVNKNLIVRFRDMEISASTIDNLIKKYFKNTEDLDKYSYNQYQTMLNPDKIIKLSIFEEDDVVCYYRSSNDGTRKVGIARRTGLKILNRGHITSSVGFDGLVWLRGKIVNDFFQRFENPEHNAWYMDMIKKMNAKKQFDALFEPFRKIIADLLKETTGSTIEAEGIAEFFPDSYASSSRRKKTNAVAHSQETLTGEIERIVPKETKSLSRSKVERTYQVYDDDGNAVSIEGSYTTLGGPNGDDIKETHGRPHEETPVAIEDEDGDFRISPSTPKENGSFQVGKVVTVKEINTKVRTNNDSYEIRVISPVDVESGYVEIKLSGESLSGVVKIISATIDGHHAEILNSYDRIKVNNIKAQVPILISITMKQTEKFALEVYLYADSKE